MTDSSSYHLGPQKTPKLLKFLIFTLLGVTLFSSLISRFTSWDLQFFLSLSIEGIKKGFYWQFFSYLFVLPSSSGISTSFLIHLLFNLYILWIVGNSLIHYRGNKHFFFLFFSVGAIASGVAYKILSLTNDFSLFNGMTTSLYGLLIAWVILHPYAKVLLFFVFPIMAKWLVLLLLGANLLIHFSNGDLIYPAAYVTASLYSYLYVLLFWKKPSPFPFLAPFERKVIALSDFLGKKRFSRKENKENSSSKIYDIRTGKPLSKEDHFVDEILDKVAKKGEESLTPKEKKKMEKISKNLNRDKKS